MNALSETRFIRDLPYVFLVVLRLAIGWHLLYEGLIKLFDPDWSSYAFLISSNSFLAPVLQALATQPTLLAITDFLNIAGLVLAGLGLMAGLFTRAAALGGALLLLLYYLANPPMAGAFQTGAAEGRYLVINKNLIEFIALLMLALIPTGRRFGLDYFRGRKGGMEKATAGPVPGEELLHDPELNFKIRRRALLRGLGTLPVLGGFMYAWYQRHGWFSFEEMNLLKKQDSDVLSGATIKQFRFTGLEELKGKIPHSRIGDLELSRVILGGNLIGGWAHARDLIYVSDLVKAYHHDEKVFETLWLAEECGINTLLTNPILSSVINKYWARGGKIQFISDCGGSNLMDMIRKSIDQGASACYVQGGVADQLVAEGKTALIGEALEFIRAHQMPAGIGAHELRTVKACVEAGFKPDFWMKTIHKTDYWSSDPINQNDNIWCTDPADTAAYMESLDQPWIAFKILAAGAYKPVDAFRWAFERGADFICVGMYDFQIVENTNLAGEILAGDILRQRPWRA